MKKKVLIIDYLSYYAHRNFNLIHIGALEELGYSLHLVGKRGQFDNIPECNMIRKSTLPDFFFRKYPSPAIYRMIYILCLLWARVVYRTNQYDFILIPTYDPLSIFAYRTKKPLVLITHDVHYLDNKIKLAFVKATPKHYIHVGLNESMADRLKELLPRRRVFHIPHGLCPVSNELSKPAFLSQKDSFVFCPVNKWYNKELVKNTFNDPAILAYFKNNGIKLVVKSKLIESESTDPIIKVDNNLAKSEYDYMIDKAIAVILPYDSCYMYRCSGIMFECVARNTPVLASNIKSMAIFKEKVDIILFSNSQELIDGVDYYRISPRKNVDKAVFSPIGYWKEVINVL